MTAQHHLDRQQSRSADDDPATEVIPRVEQPEPASAATPAPVEPSPEPEAPVGAPHLALLRPSSVVKVAAGVTAVVVEQTDTGAALSGLGSAVERAGLRCPRDLSLAVLGAPTGTRGSAPGGGAAFSGFDVPMRAMGRAAVRLLLALIANSAHPGPVRHLLRCDPVSGGTIAAPAPPEDSAGHR